jgi:hypothetical protein
MHGYFDGSEVAEPKDKAHQSIMLRLNSFMECLPTQADRDLLSKMVLECYCKYSESIKAKERDDPSLFMPLVMSLLLDQQLMIDKLKNNRRNNVPPL